MRGANTVEAVLSEMSDAIKPHPPCAQLGGGPKSPRVPTVFHQNLRSTGPPRPPPRRTPVPPCPASRRRHRPPRAARAGSLGVRFGEARPASSGHARCRRGLEIRTGIGRTTFTLTQTELDRAAKPKIGFPGSLPRGGPGGSAPALRRAAPALARQRAAGGGVRLGGARLDYDYLIITAVLLTVCPLCC